VFLDINEIIDKKPNILWQRIKKLFKVFNRRIYTENNGIKKMENKEKIVTGSY